MMNNESGRSMVEMLGVLAIIGVLSVAGIAGYTMAMRAYRANEVLQGASLLYSTCRAMNGGLGPTSGTSPSYSDLISDKLPGNAASITCTGIDKVKIVAHDGPDCKAIANKVGNAGIVTASSCGGTTGAELTLTYSNS